MARISSNQLAATLPPPPCRGPGEFLALLCSACDSKYPLMSLCLLDFAFPCYPWSECFLDGEPPHYSGDLTSRTTRSLNLRRHELQFIHRNTVRPSNALKEPLPTVTSPVFSEIVLCSSRKACFGHCRETCVARDVWNHTVSRGILFGDIRGVEGTKYRSLGNDDAEEAAKGSLDFHPWVPLVCSYAVTKHGRIISRYGLKLRSTQFLTYDERQRNPPFDFNG